MKHTGSTNTNCQRGKWECYYSELVRQEHTGQRVHVPSRDVSVRRVGRLESFVKTLKFVELKMRSYIFG